jgi:anti-sigma B factor antagonist
VETFSMQTEPGRVAVTGELDLAAAPRLADALASLDEGSGAVTVDLAETTFVDSRGLATLVAAHHRLGGHLRVVNVRPEVRRVFEITKLDDVLLRDD